MCCGLELCFKQKLYFSAFIQECDVTLAEKVSVQYIFQFFLDLPRNKVDFFLSALSDLNAERVKNSNLKETNAYLGEKKVFNNLFSIHSSSFGRNTTRIRDLENNLRSKWFTWSQRKARAFEKHNFKG